MADMKVSDMGAATAFTGVELLEVVQGGVNVKGTVKAVGSFCLPTSVQAEDITGSEAIALDPGVGFLDLTPLAGDATLTNMTGAVDGQIVIISNLAVGNNLIIPSNANVRVNSSLALLPNSSYTLRFSESLNLWVGMS